MAIFQGLLALTCFTAIALNVYFENDTARAGNEPSGLSKEEYSQKYPQHTGNEGDKEAIKTCLSSWGRHPFGKEAQDSFRIFAPQVRVMGIGGEVKDDAATSYPQLILVKPSVNVLTKTTVELLNPNGWYCLRNNVTVLSKNIIKLQCKAHLADTASGVSVLGSNNATTNGVTVLGKSTLTRVGC